ncbi:MAG: NADH-quinone oxidoreductase subunit C [Opitutae bacterium]|nr:NADH-quinone oxidoreductase subunit C [Opitutae bacterium]
MPAPTAILPALQTRFPRLTLRASADHPAVNIPADEAGALLKTLRDEFGFAHLADLTAVDGGPGATPRFTVVWHLFSLTAHGYFRVAAHCADDAEPAMPSTTPLWPAADWHEREIWDMFGITFPGHADLRRILMWDGYPYHPLRKEFPLAGLPTELPDAEIAAEIPTKVIAAPMAGGPFVATTGELNLGEAEPRAKDESWNERREKPDA